MTQYRANYLLFPAVLFILGVLLEIDFRLWTVKSLISEVSYYFIIAVIFSLLIRYGTYISIDEQAGLVKFRSLFVECKQTPIEKITSIEHRPSWRILQNKLKWYYIFYKNISGREKYIPVRIIFSEKT